MTSGTDWHGRAASQRRSSGRDFPLPKKQEGKIQALQRAIKVLQMASATKHRTEARYLLSRARALIEALPASQTVQERKQLAELRRKFGAGGKAAPKSDKKPKPNPVLKSKVAPKPKPQPVPKPDLAPKPDPKSRRRRAKRKPVDRLSKRYIDRAALGYAPVDETKGSRTR
nr:hypothetical protein [Streptomyces sp. SID9913]